MVFQCIIYLVLKIIFTLYEDLGMYKDFILKRKIGNDAFSKEWRDRFSSHNGKCIIVLSHI